MASLTRAELARAQQRRLAALGFYKGRIDGDFGPASFAADAAALDRLTAILAPEPTGSGLVVPSVDYRTALEVGHHEAVVRQAYKDSAGVWTWSVGLTSATGHSVTRYIGAPQPMQHCLDVYVWALRRYARQVDEVFAGRALTAAQYAGAVSFHWNTGSIRTASWVGHFKAGRHDEAEASFKTWNKSGGKVVPALRVRRESEADLIWRGLWSNDGTMLEYTRVTGAHRPDWASGVRRDVKVEMLRAFGQAVEPVLDGEPQPLNKPAAPTLTAV